VISAINPWGRRTFLSATGALPARPRPTPRAALAAGRPVRTAWSVGCATGEEGLLRWRWRSPRTPPEVRVHGSDISRESLEVARLGRYGSWSFRDGPRSGWRSCARWAAQWEVSLRLKTMVSFHEVNLAREPLTAPRRRHRPGRHLLPQRAALLSLPDQSARILSALGAALAEGGLMVLGALEAPALPPVGPAGGARVQRLRACASRSFSSAGPWSGRPPRPRRYSTAERRALPSCGRASPWRCGWRTRATLEVVAQAGGERGRLAGGAGAGGHRLLRAGGPWTGLRAHLGRVLELSPDHVPAPPAAGAGAPARPRPVISWTAPSRSWSGWCPGGATTREGLRGRDESGVCSAGAGGPSRAAMNDPERVNG